jgi:hypothetical protein
MVDIQPIGLGMIVPVNSLYKTEGSVSSVLNCIRLVLFLQIKEN